jgi:hypothetical protein
MGVTGLLYGSCYLEPFYFVWEAITRCKDGAAQVNLLLNRSSPWLDIDSYLPYAGQVVLHNKGCHSLCVRMPRWVDRTAIACNVNGRAASIFWAGNYLAVSGLAGKETVTIEFPVAAERVETAYLLTRDVGPKWWGHTGELPTYILHMRGNTCVKAEFPNRDKFTQAEPVYPVFQREHFRVNQTPMKEAVRYVAPTVIPW